MKGDFSRLPFLRGKHYSGVRQQQGRVMLDSDWNEQASIRERAERKYVEELVGSAGGAESAFAVVADGSVVHITAGVMYVGGFRCELDHDQPLALAPSPGRTHLIYLDAWERHLTWVDDPSLLEPSLGGTDTTTRVEVAWNAHVREDVGHVPPDARLPAQPDGIMFAAAPAGYRGLANQLYRVEIHDAGDAATATFNWSRNNGATVFAVREFVAATTIALETPSELAPGDYVEVSGEDTESRCGAGTLASVSSRPDDLTVVLDRDVSRHARESHPRLRRWDGAGVPLPSNWFELEAGIEIRFSDGSYRTGDYWTIPARAGSSSIEWPGDRTPDGPEHRLAPLALVRWHDDGKVEIRDCRRVFVPLTELYEELHRLRREVEELRRKGV